MRVLLHIIILTMLSGQLFAQESVYLESDENGNGFLKSRDEQCFIITPKHVVENSDGIKVINRNQKKSNATAIQLFEQDLAVLEPEEGTSLRCTGWSVEPNLDGIVEASAQGVIEHKQVTGTVKLIPVNIIGITSEYIQIIPQDEGVNFQKGYSGSPFYILYNGRKILAGMLVNISNPSGDNPSGQLVGHVLKLSQMERIIASFFSEYLEKKKLGILIVPGEAASSQPASLLFSGFDDKSQYTPISPVPGAGKLEQQVDQIVNNGNFSFPASLKGELDELLLGKISLKKSRSQQNLAIVEARFTGGLYSMETSKMKRALNLKAMGLKREEDAAEEQAVKMLMQKLKNQLK